MGKKVKLKDRMIPVLMYLTPKQIKFLEKRVKKGDTIRASKSAIVRSLIYDVITFWGSTKQKKEV